MLHVMQKNGEYFIKLGNAAESYKVNGQTPTQQCNGNKNWWIFNEPITSIRMAVPSSRRLDKFVLKPPFVDNPGKLEPELPADTFDYDYDNYGDRNWYGENVEFYEAVYVNYPATYTTVEFEIIDRDCCPVLMIPEVVIDFPANIKHYPETQHKYPCHINYSDVYNMVHDAIIAKCKEKPEALTYDNYKNIQTLSVYLRIAIPKQLRKPRKHSYYKTMRSKKMSTKIVYDEYRQELFLHIVGTYKNDNEGIQIQSVSGENYADLMKNLQTYIDSFVNLVDIDNYSLCEHCGGVGYIQEKK